MNKKIKRITGIIAATVCAATAFAFAACDKSGGTGGGVIPGDDQNKLPTGLDPYVLSVEITQAPFKTDYLVGETFSPDGLAFDSHWNVDGEEIVIDMNYSDCDGWTHRDEPLAIGVDKITFTIEEFDFDVKITVEEGKPDLPMTGVRLVLATNVDKGASTSNVKENGKTIAADAENGTLVIDNVIYSGFTEYGFGGGISDSAYPILIIQGGGLSGTQTEGTRTKVRYVFNNTGNTAAHFRFYYDYGKAGGDIGSSKILSLASGEAAVTEFFVRTDLVPNGESPWVRLEVLNNTNAAKISAVGYDVGKIAADKYDLTLDGGIFADGTASKLLSEGETPEIEATLKGTQMGWYNVLDPAERWMTGEEFAMPAHDVILRPIAITTGYQEVSVNPRKTSGGQRYEINNGTNGESGKVGEIDNASEGYSDKKIKYTLYPQAEGSKAISGCGNHFDNDERYDRLFKLTFTHISGAADLVHWVDFKASKGLVKKLTTASVKLDAEHGVVTVYLIIPRGLKVNENGEAGFQFDIMQTMTENAVFVFESAYARMA